MADPLGIAESLAEVVLRMLDLELAYIRVPQPSGALLEAGRTRRHPVRAGRGSEIGRGLAGAIPFDGSEPPRTIANPEDGEPVTLALVPIGHDEHCGWLAAATKRREFPDEREGLLLGVAANQLAVMLQRKAVEEALRESAARLAEADRRKDEFLAILAHELRNPLAPLRNGLQILQLRADEPRLVAEAWSMMERQLGQLVRLIDDLLDLSRINVDKIELRRAPTDLGTVLRDAAEATRTLFEHAGHTLMFDLPPQPLLVHGDGLRLTQVFGNLLNNAAKYTKSGGRIALSVVPLDSRVRVAVRDNGVGIDPPMLTRVFDMFTQADASLERAYGGLGIGLTIVKRLVELHGGTVEAHSDGLGCGSEFVVDLPLLESETSRSTEEPGVADPPRVRRRILIADDNADAAESLAVLLQVLGHDVHVAADGRAALDAADVLEPELVLLDIGMPKMNGHEACAAMRTRPWSTGSTLVALSGWGQDEHKTRAREAGFDHYLVKPVTPEALQQLLASLRSPAA